MAEKILAAIIPAAAVACALGLLLWIFQQYLELPVVKFSATQQRIVAVEDARGKPLPFSPLPEKYEKIYVK